MKDRFLSIGVLAKKTRTSVRMLRYFEKFGLLKPRRLGERRAYPQDDVNHVAVINVYKSLGFTLKEVQKLRTSIQNKAFGSALTMVDSAMADVESKFARLEQQKFFLARLRKKLATSQRPHEARCFLCGNGDDGKRSWWGASLDLFCEPCIKNFHKKHADSDAVYLRCTACGKVGESPVLEGVDGAICRSCLENYASQLPA